MRCDAGLVTITHGRYLNGWLRRSRVRKRRVAGACCVTSSTYILLESSLLGSRPFYFFAIYLFFLSFMHGRSWEICLSTCMRKVVAWWVVVVVVVGLTVVWSSLVWSGDWFGERKHKKCGRRPSTHSLHCIFDSLFFSVHWTHSSVCLFVLEEILIPAAAMKSTILTSFLLAATTAIHTALAYSPPLKITSMTTHQPIGSGSTNFYYINFAIQGIPSRRFSSSSSSAYCQISWGDNGWTNPQPYSIHVPTGTWMNCDSTPGSYDGTSAFQFQLFPYFSIGNFTVGVKQDLGRGRRYVLVLFLLYIHVPYTCNA